MQKPQECIVSMQYAGDVSDATKLEITADIVELVL